MKYILALLLFSVMCVNVVYASNFSAKTGTIVWSMSNASKLNPYFELAYDHDISPALFPGLKETAGLSVGYYNLLVEGEERISPGVFGNSQYRLRLHAVPIIARYTVSSKSLYCGIGGGVQLLSSERMYDDVCGWDDGKYYNGKPRSHDTYVAQFRAGWNINDDWAIEAAYNQSDLDIESGVATIGIAENESTLNMAMVSVVRRF